MGVEWMGEMLVEGKKMGVGEVGDLCVVVR